MNVAVAVAESNILEISWEYASIREYSRNIFGITTCALAAVRMAFSDLQ